MRLILAEYINSLKEDRELDVVIQDILRANSVEIFTKPERGRQYGVDIYAVGKDFTGDQKRKVFLITVKQGDLDRSNWDANVNSVRQSIDEIIDVFVPNNLASQHRKLPIKIVVAYNGLMKQGVQQNWVGYTNRHPTFEFDLWESDFLIYEFQDKLLNEGGFSNEIRSLIRKTIIHLEDPSYKLKDFTDLLSALGMVFKEAKSKKAKLKVLKQLRLIVTIVLKYCHQADNLLHSVRCSEKYMLFLWALLKDLFADEESVKELVAGVRLQMDAFAEFYSKFSFVTRIKDGYSRGSGDSVEYGFVLYEHLGIFSLLGLQLFQLSETLEGSTNSDKEKASDSFRQKAVEIASDVIHGINSNQIFYSPRSEDHLIEIHLVLMLLYKLDMKDHASGILMELGNKIAEGYAYSRNFPVFRDYRKIAELEIDHQARIKYDYNSTNLFAMLIEWSLVLDRPEIYQFFKSVKDNLLKELNLLIWFPEKETENFLYDGYASHDSGYELSGIELLDSFSDFRALTLEEFVHNCYEKDFTFIKENFWSVGLLASRHYRTYIFPYYWRQFLTPASVGI